MKARQAEGALGNAGTRDIGGAEPAVFDDLGSERIGPPQHFSIRMLRMHQPCQFCSSS
jgi:hypothetical protein